MMHNLVWLNPMFYGLTVKYKSALHKLLLLCKSWFRHSESQPFIIYIDILGVTWNSRVTHKPWRFNTFLSTMNVSRITFWWDVRCSVWQRDSSQRYVPETRLILLLPTATTRRLSFSTLYRHLRVYIHIKIKTVLFLWWRYVLREFCLGTKHFTQEVYHRSLSCFTASRSTADN
jgi:hypothetical protein